MVSENNQPANTVSINASVFKKTQGRNVGLYAVTALIDGHRHTRTLSTADVQTYFSLDKEGKKSFVRELAGKYLTPKNKNADIQQDLYDIHAIQYGYELKFLRELNALTWQEKAEMAEDFAGSLRPIHTAETFYFPEIDDAKAFAAHAIKINGDRILKSSLKPENQLFWLEKREDLTKVLDRHLPACGGYIAFEKHFTFEDPYFKTQEAVGIASDEKYGYAVVLADKTKVPYQSLKYEVDLMNHLTHESLLADAVGKGDEVSFVGGYEVPSKTAYNNRDCIDMVKFDDDGKLNIIGSRIVLKNGEQKTKYFDHGNGMSLEGIKELYSGVREMREAELQETQDISEEEEADEEEEISRGFHR